MLEVQNLEKVFKKKAAVDHINLYIEKGESVGLLGPNGAGKSTTISMISTLLHPTNGRVQFYGKDVFEDARDIRSKMGVVPQEIALYEELSALENLQFFGKIHGLRGQILKEKIQETLGLVGLKDRQKDPVKDYSGGMKRRVNLAVALLHDPELLIMDEPTVGIDPQSRNYILEMIRKLNKEKQLTVLYTSHYMEEVEKLCDRVYIMDHGQVVASGTNEELRSILSNEETIEVKVKQTSEAFKEKLLEHPSVNQVIAAEGSYTLIVTNSEQLLVQLFEYAEESSMSILGIQIKKPTLEDVFLHLTGRTLRD
ncbi:ABC transporter ATP-binding protein [Marinilactibacillus piezotolerans]|uniref:ABC transporter ATP-binding protein n=1 Tax=Marinilactibacillus piezotolerans TaxID=258723 RepID=UPI0009AFEF62|nr:ABC transporter ATP-binding protein [Marinilactibacillus piezotolerans]